MSHQQRAKRRPISNAMLTAMLAARVTAEQIHSPMVRALLASLARALH